MNKRFYLFFGVSFFYCPTPPTSPPELKLPPAASPENSPDLYSNIIANARPTQIRRAIAVVENNIPPSELINQQRNIIEELKKKLDRQAEEFAVTIKELERLKEDKLLNRCEVVRINYQFAEYKKESTERYNTLLQQKTGGGSGSSGITITRDLATIAACLVVGGCVLKVVHTLYSYGDSGKRMKAYREEQKKREEERKIAAKKAAEESEARKAEAMKRIKQRLST